MTKNSIRYQKTIVLHKTDVNKYFRIKNKFCKSFKVTKNHVHYAECYLEKDLKVPNIKYGEKKHIYTYILHLIFLLVMHYMKQKRWYKIKFTGIRINCIMILLIYI